MLQEPGQAVTLTCGEITPAMIEAGVHALSLRCPLDIAFPVGGEETAVEAVLSAALGRICLP